MPTDSHFQYDQQPQQATPTEQQPRKRVWINVTPEVNLGHILSALSFLGALFAYGQSFDRRMTIAEQKIETSAAQSAELKADIKEIKKTVTEIGTNLAVQNAIAQAAAAQAAKR